MSVFQTLSIAKKIYITSALGITMIAGMIANQQYANHTVADSEAVVEREQIIFDGIANAEKAFSNMNSALRDMFLSKSRAELDEAFDRLGKSADTGQAGMDKPISIAKIPDVLVSIKSSLKDFAGGSAAIRDYVLQQNFTNLTELDSLRARYTKPVAAKLQDAITGSITNARKFTGEAKASLADTKSTIGLINTIIQLAIVMVLIASAFVLRRTVVVPLTSIAGAMTRLAKGDDTIGIPFAGRADEIGVMAGAVEVFRQAAVANRELEADAAKQRNTTEEQRRAAEQEERARAQALQVVTSTLGSGLKRLASGDLAFQLTEAFAPDFEALRHDFNQSIGQLGTALTSISTSIAIMDSGTREIAAGASDLSKRTEQQAAALEETAAALDEITVNVSNSTKRTEEARAVATQANVGAAQSVQVVSHAEEAMRRIEESSQQISNIIGVIDEIAFQTNLLALNAGVEAARAGDAGKGFAVVAQEVRELAQRSAQAAKEIKGLIQNSSKEVEGGVKLVRDTGEALQSIGTFIVQINTHMDAIATSAKEQAVGLAEVNTAVNNMDQTTQQNAAMVEQSTAASSSLASEAEKLRDLVNQFQLGGTASAQTSALHNTARAMAQAPASIRLVMQSATKAAPARGNTALAQSTWEEF